MKNLRRMIFGILATLLVASPINAQDVTLKSRDGSIEISGSLIGFDGEFYRVDSVYGVLTVDGSGVVCAGPGCPDLSTFIAKIRLSGAPIMIRGLFPHLIDGFAAAQNYALSQAGTEPNRTVFSLASRGDGQVAAVFTLLATSSDEGIADLVADEADIALSIREVTEQEVSFAEDAGIGRLDAPNQSRVIALDGLVPIVSEKNPVEALTLQQLQQIFEGKIDNWQDVGGLDAPINVNMVDANSGVAQAFAAALQIEAASVGAGLVRQMNLKEVSKAVAANPFAIGATLLSETDTSKVLKIRGECGFVLEASNETLKTEDYPLTAPMFVYVPAIKQSKIGREFLRYIQSPTAQASISQAGFAGQEIVESGLAVQGNRISNAILAAGEEVTLDDLRQMIQTLEDANRLSVGFRFDGGSSKLDAQSRSNVVLMARLLESGRFDGQELVFVGFSDSDGAAAANKRLSRKRAIVVRDAILREAITLDRKRLLINVEAFGEAMPMACDDNDWGRQINRRVEIWVR